MFQCLPSAKPLDPLNVSHLAPKPINFRSLIVRQHSNMPGATDSPPDGCEHYDDPSEVPTDIVK